MKGGTSRCLLLLLLLVLVAPPTGCRESTRLEVPGGARAGVLTEQEGVNALHRLPETLRGVWYRDDPEGASSCDRFRAVPSGAGGTDEAMIALIGSLVVTSNLIHEYAEYGEGNFHVVESVEPANEGAWQVRTWLGIDAIPQEPSAGRRVVSQLALQSGKLHWRSSAHLGQATSTYFRCGDVRSDGHHPVGEESTGGAAS